ncbi:MAG: DEAD/DEAH box helicase [Planctomycetes bacterium]|nr:DEAD/DEAH box helicase [Planctomycetota bacterium]
MSEFSSEVLGPGGRIHSRLPAYESRPQQLAMANAVADAFASGGCLVVEAGTGVGKSFAYLVPAIEQVTKRGGRVVISTHTIALQEQLMEKDIPFLQSIFGDTFSAVLVKGRSNYLGLRRLTRASQRQELLFDTKNELSELHAIQQWAYNTADGSLSDLNWQPSLKVWDAARSDGDDCLGRKCPQFEKCFYQRARRRVEEAQLLIVNHALLFSDLALRAIGASILPDYEHLILDEAHTAEGVAGDHLGVSITNTQIRYTLGRLYNERTGKGLLRPTDAKKLASTVTNAQRIADRYFAGLIEWQFNSGDRNGRIREMPPVDQRVSGELHTIKDGLRDIRKELDSIDDQSEMQSMMERVGALAGSIDDWHQHKTKDWVYWLESDGEHRKRITLAARPVDIGPYLQANLFQKMRTTVLTSATLNTDSTPTFTYLRERLSLDAPTMTALGSPFDYAEQLKVYVEAGMPEPASREFTPAACAAIKKYVQMSAGRAFVLFTSYEMLRQCADELKEFFQSREMPLFVHGSGMPRTQMLNKFRTTPRSVLFGTDTFWAGVDVPGDALSNVIIVKLPFAVPNHPLVEARIEQIQARGGNAFMEFQVPEAVLKFRQGVGRLIRTNSDKGIVVILDPRIVTKPYGRRFLDALPKCPVEISRQKY